MHSREVNDTSYSCRNTTCWNSIKLFSNLGKRKNAKQNSQVRIDNCYVIYYSYPVTHRENKTICQLVLITHSMGNRLAHSGKKIIL